MNKRNGNASRWNGSEVGQCSRYTIPKKRAGSPLSGDNMDKEQRSSLKKAKVLRMDNPWHFDSTNLSTLPIIQHQPTYIPFYVDPQLDALPTKMRMAKIMDHHLEVAKRWKRYLLSQGTYAMLGSPVQGRMLTNGDTEKRKVIAGCSKDASNGDNTYISRSGRHVRRVLDNPVDNDASDDDDDDDDVDESSPKRRESSKSFTRGRPKKASVPNDTETSLRSLNVMGNRSQRAEAILRESQKQSVEDPNESFKQSLMVSSDSDVESVHSPAKKTPPEMNRSQASLRKRNISTNSPTTTTTTVAKTNCTEPQTSTLNGMKQKLEKRGEAMFREMQKLSTEDNKQQHEDDFKESIFAPSKYNTTRNEIVNAGASTSADLSPTKPTTSQTNGKKRGPKLKTTDCPICSGTFPTREIEEHASTCGITSVLEIQSNLPGQVQNLY